MKQEHNDMRNAEKVGLTTTKPNTTFKEMWNAIGDSPSYIVSSDKAEHGEDEDDHDDNSELGKLNENDKPG